MNVSTVINKINELNLEVRVDGDKLFISPSSAIPNELVPAIQENKPDLLWHYQLLTMAFPVGYKGLPEATVIAAEAWCDHNGVTDRIKRKIEVCSWSMDTIRNETPKDLAIPEFYWEVRKEKHRLIHADFKLSGVKGDCGICDFTPYEEPTEEGTE